MSVYTETLQQMVFRVFISLSIIHSLDSRINSELQSISRKIIQIRWQCTSNLERKYNCWPHWLQLFAWMFHRYFCGVACKMGSFHFFRYVIYKAVISHLIEIKWPFVTAILAVSCRQYLYSILFHICFSLNLINILVERSQRNRNNKSSS